MDVEKEIEQIKVRLVKIEKHVETCDAHEKTEEHEKGHEKGHDKKGEMHHDHGKKV